jgi:penicillin-binding protein 1C
MKEKLKKYIHSKLTKIVLTIFVLGLILDLLSPLPNLKQYSKQILSNDGTLLTAYLTDDDKWRMRTNIEDVSPNLVKAVIEKEDSWFYWHLGVNPVSLVRAIYSNIVSGKRVSGASTISMQVVRLLEPKDRTYGNKILEIFRAIQLELHYTKKEILEIYLSLLPFGGNIEGVESASYIYFYKPPKQLSLAQAILLASIPNDPNSRRLDQNNKEVKVARDYWINYFKEHHTFSDKNLNDAIDEPVEFNRYAVPVLAPHFSYYIKEHSNSDIVNTNLNLRIQKTAENLLYNHVQRVNPKGVTNGAVLIIDNDNSSVVGYCGSADFYDAASSGQVNGVIAVRSPGSTLKAPLYAYAFDEGILTPGMKLLDIPTDFNGYEPENYDLKFYGNVTAEFALRNSLNIPAVRLLQEISTGNFISLLEKSGFSEIADQKKRLGLSMILGGCGVTLEELTRMFSSFARDGELHSLVYIKDDLDDDSEIPVFSKASSYLVAQILSGFDRNDIADLSNYSQLPKFAWKTGTSYGRRDAWAIGFNPDFTIGVWMGNFDGKGSPYLSGAEIAVPLLFDLFNSIDYKPEKKWFRKPNDIIKRQVCSESGMLPSKYCTKIISDYIIKNTSNNLVCNVHQPVYVDSDETVQYCTECLPSNGYKKVVYPVYDPELTVWLEQNNYNFKKPPSHNLQCQAKFTTDGPKILSPSEDYEYYLEENADQEIMLLAASDSKAKYQYWYVNDKFYKKCKPGDKVFIKPDRDKLKITCLDDKGRDEIVRIKVKYY